ncbi:MAG: hypothetical protein HY294_11950 [Candidatus Rokubacteria bacterium]|nr:hypothetical protein [Candidatus Rokubacteria bacterium]
MSRIQRVVILASLVLQGAAGRPALAADRPLGPAPFVVTVSPGTWTEGAPVAIALEPQAGRLSRERADVYLIRVPPGLVVRRYLAPTNTWAVRIPVAYGRDVALPSALHASWREEGPLGWSTILIIFVPPGADPHQRANWLWRPIIVKSLSRVTPTAAWPAGLTLLAPLGLASAVAVGLVVRAGRPRA